MSIYQEIILHEFKNPKHYGSLSGDSIIVGAVNNPLCGDKLTFYGKVVDGFMADIKYEGIGCAISIASASLLTDMVVGKKINTIHKLGQKDILGLLGIELSPNRLKCALLPLEGLQKIIVQK